MSLPRGRTQGLKRGAQVNDDPSATMHGMSMDDAQREMDKVSGAARTYLLCKLLR